MRRVFWVGLVGVVALGAVAAGWFLTRETEGDWDNWQEPSEVALSDQPPSELEIVSYNVFLRPTEIGAADYPECRSAEIALQLSEFSPDVVALQEAWEPTGVSNLVEGTDPVLLFRVVGKPATTSDDDEAVLSGGLSILSRWPIVDVSTLSYDTCYLDDCLATKGALHAVVQVAVDSYVQVVTTHLDAGVISADRDARDSQLEQLSRFLDGLDPEMGPVVLLGDFNIDSLADDGEYEQLLETLAVRDGDVVSTTRNSGIFTSDKPVESRLDYIFTMAGDSRLVRRNTDHLPMATDACGSDGPDFLSDHQLVTATFTTSSG